MKRSILFFLVALISSAGFSQTKIDKNTFGDVRARNLGPAVMSGRIATLDAVMSDPRILYVGTAGGGIWKSENEGTTFKPVFKKNIQAIGAITIDQKHPDTVWAGTGEPWTRNSTSVGKGVYVTYDGGENWKLKGLDSTERIARIVIDPKDSATVYVAALGPLWSAGEQRGLFKTTDGGTNWEKILYVDENTGCSGFAINPGDPDIMYAGFWDFRRHPWDFISGGKGSSFFMTTDGGKTWDKIEEGLPEKPWGRVYVDVSPADPNVVYLLIEAKKTSLYRSEDMGKTWTLMNNNSGDVGERPFYFGFFVPDPVDTNTVYKPGFALQVSDDGGKKFMGASVKGGFFHSDVHALWINPNDHNMLYLGTDGGVYLSKDRGATWKFFKNLPVSQFYHVNVDNEKPYNVFGGLQDNGSWIAPSKSPGGIGNNDWNNIGYGDGFNVIRDPSDNNIMYWQYQGGNVKRMYLDTREFKDIKPFTKDGTKLRFHWNTPLIIGAKSKALYTGSQFLYKSTDKGDSWKILSPDLTTNDPAKQEQEKTGGLTIDNSAAENHCTIFTISESPLDENIIWVGTDDGNLQITQNGGKNWDNVINNIEGIPPTTWVSYVEASNYDKGTAYVTFDGHRYGDRNAYVYKTIDFGKTWTKLSDDNIESYCHVIKEDLKNPDLLFLGTEAGMYLSINGGEVWSRFTGNLPKVSVRDMVFQPRENDLVLATHGRGIYIIDDLTPLQNLTMDKVNQKMAWLGSKPYSLGFSGVSQEFNGNDGFGAPNPSNTVMINYYMKKRHIFGKMHIEIFNSDGKLIKKLPGGKRKGINRVAWNISMKRPKVPASVQIMGAVFQGPDFPPGEYLVKVIKNKDTIQGTVLIKYDDNPHHSVADRDLRLKTVMQAYNMLQDLAYLDLQMREIRDQSKQFAGKTKGGLHKKLLALSDKVEGMRKEIVATKEGRITGEERLREKIGTLYGGVISYLGKPTESQLSGITELQKEMDQYLNSMNEITEKEIPALNKKLEKAGQSGFKLTDKDTFLKKD
jgi:photosystem II stability/assembly factor-like uncharacterized protein